MFSRHQAQAFLSKRIKHNHPPQNLAQLTDIDETREVDAESLGLTYTRVNKIWQAVEQLYQSGVHPGISFCLRYKGEVVLNRSIGYAQTSNDELNSMGSPMCINTPVCLFSASKAVMAMLVHKLAESGKINLLHPVAHYIPEFGVAGKDKITIYQMLSHRGGFHVVKDAAQLAQGLDREAILQAIYQTPCRSPEGREQAYHAVSTGFIVDELIRRVVGKDINRFLKTTFSSPMDMRYFQYGLPKKDRDQAAHNYITGMDNPRIVKKVLKNALGVSLEEATLLSNETQFMDSIIPSGNLYATAEEMSRFYQMLLDGGRYQDKTILTKATVDIATKEASSFKIDKGIYIPMRFSAGFMLGGNPIGLYGLNSGRAFGHLGFSNIFCWADPSREIAASLLTTGKPVLGKHVIALPRLLHAITSLSAS